MVPETVFVCPTPTKRRPASRMVGKRPKPRSVLLFWSEWTVSRMGTIWPCPPTALFVPEKGVVDMSWALAERM